MFDVLIITLPVFLIIFLGWLAARTTISEEGWVHTLNTFVYFVSLPALILIGFWRLDFGGGALLDFIGIHLVSLIAMALVTGLLLTLFKASRSVKASIFMGALMGNTIYMGFPVAGRAFGADVESTIVLSATIFLLFGMVLSLIYIEILDKGERSFKKHVMDFAKNPLLIALVAGIILNLSPLSGKAVDVIQSTLGMLAATASPVALFALGIFFSGTSFREKFGWVALSSGLKLILLPVIAWLTILIYQTFIIGNSIRPLLINGTFILELRQITLLISAMPAAVTSFVLAERFNLDRTIAANTIVVSTIASFVTLWIILSTF